MAAGDIRLQQQDGVQQMTQDAASKPAAAPTLTAQDVSTAGDALLAAQLQSEDQVSSETNHILHLPFWHSPNSAQHQAHTILVPCPILHEAQHTVPLHGCTYSEVHLMQWQVHLLLPT